MDVLIVDDNHPTGLYLKQIVSKIPDANVVGVATSGEEAIRLTSRHNPQLVFMDIDMPGMSGLEVARRLGENHHDLIFIFATAYPNYALEAFEIYPFDYILKPFDEKRIRKTWAKLQASMKGRLLTPAVKPEAIAVQVHGDTVVLNPAEIIYLESHRADVLIKTASQEFRLRSTLAEWEQRLSKAGFAHSHRSYLVNVSQIKQVSRYGCTYDLLLKSGDRIPLSRSCAKQLKDLLTGV